MTSVPRPVLLALAVVFAGATTLYAGIWMKYVRWRPQAFLGVDFDYAPLAQAMLVHQVVAGSAAEQAGLRASDRIVAVNSRSLESLEPFWEAVVRGRPGDRVRLSVERPEAPGRLQLDATLRARPDPDANAPLAQTLAAQLIFCYPVLFLAVGLPVLFLRLDDLNAWLLSLLFASMIAGAPLLPFEPAIHPALRGFALAYKVAFSGVSAALFYFFFAVFPSPSPIERRLPWLKWVLLGSALAVSVPLALWGFWEGYSHRLVEWARQSWVQLALFLVVAYGLGTFALGLISLVWNSLRAPSAEARRKTRVMVWGTVAAVAPILLFSGIAAAMGREIYSFPFWAWALVVLALFLLPLSFAYAVVMHRVLEIPVLLRRSARYLLVRRGVDILLLLLALLFFEVATGFADFFEESFGGSQGTLVSGVGFGMVFGVLFLLAHRHLEARLGRRIDRAFFRSAYDARQILEDLAEKTRTATSREELATLLRRQVREALYPHTRHVYLADSSGQLRAVSSDVPAELEALPHDWPLLAVLARRGQPLDVPPPEARRESAFFLLDPLQPECLVPLVGREANLVGLLVLGPRLSEEPYSSEDKRLLASVASQAAAAVENIRLAETIAERREAERLAAQEIEIAKKVQTRLFPQKKPPLQTLDYAGHCLQARAVGGDYYDFLELGPGRVGLVLADIAGKGISAALLMANLQANLRSQYAVALEDLPRLLRSVNRLFCENTEPANYATVFFAVYEDATRRLQYENCGHNPPLLVRAAGAVERLRGTATVLGMFENWHCAVAEVEIEPGDLLVIYSDGVSEAASDTEELFGEARLLETIQAHCHGSAEEVLRAIVAAVEQFSGREQEDDITLVVARAR